MNLAQPCRSLNGWPIFMALAAAWLLTAPLPGQQPDPPPKKAEAAKKPAPLEARFMDDGTLKLTVLDERLELVTAYGKLLIPMSDINRIEFGLRIPDDVAKKIEAAVADLGHKDFKRRDVASGNLADAGVWAYPALLEAAKNPDPEIVRRAEELLKKLRQSVPADLLEMRDQDVVHTNDSKISGRLAATSLKVKTAQFGEQQLKLADIRSLGTPSGGTADLGDALPDPGTLGGFPMQVGKTFVFQVTGAPPGSRGAWGTEVYTVDSTLAVAAVHAGVLRSGQTGKVRVTILGPVAGFMASTQNGISSFPYGGYAGYRVSKWEPK